MMKQEERDQLLVNIANKQEERDQLLVNIVNKQEERDQLLINIVDKQEVTEQVIGKILHCLESLYKGQEELFKNQKEMREELTRVGNTVAKIEYEHGRKIDLILDVLTGHGEKLEEHDKRLEKDEKIIQNQGYRIYALEQKSNT